MSVKILGVIPARFASLRLPGKPLLPILGKSLLQRTFENAKKATLLDKLLIATDHEGIFDHAFSFGGEVIMTPQNCMNGTDRIAFLLQERPDLLQADAIVNIQGDDPCIDPLSIEKAVHLLLEDPLASMATIITPLKSEEDALNPSIVKCVKDLNDNALYFSRALIPSNKKQAFSFQSPYFQHIGLYVYRPEFLLRYLSLKASPLQLEEDLEQLKALEYGYRIKVAMTDYSGTGVDTPEDLIKLEKWLCAQNSSL